MNSLTRTIVLGFILVILSLGLTYELYFINTAEGQVLEAIKQADLQIGNDSRLRGIINLQENSSSELKILETAILTREDLVTLVEGLEKMGRDEGLMVSISSITNEPNKTSTTTPETVRIAIEASGSWIGNIHFIRLLENLPFKVNIERLDLSTNETGWKSNTSIKLIIYPEK